MGLWTDYTKKDTPEDNDTLMLYDAAGKANKQILFSGFWKWVAKKLKEATLSNLQTTDKTMIGAINELNSKAFKAISVTGKEYNLDDYDDKSNYYVLYGMDTGTNIGTALPDSKVAKALSFNGIQLAASYAGKYYIRFKWGTWRPWVEIS